MRRFCGDDVQVVVGGTLLNEYLAVGKLANRAQRGKHAALLFAEVRRKLRGAQREQRDFVVHRVSAHFLVVRSVRSAQFRLSV